jgi:hypothetical protein
MKLVIPHLVHKKIMHWVNKSGLEVSGLGKVIHEPDGTMSVLDVIMLPQKNTMAHTDIEGEDVGKAMYLLRDTPGELRFWWHSHVDMNVFWSSQDHETIKLCGQGGWCVATVFNKKNETRTAFYSVDGAQLPWGKQSLFYDDIKLEVSPVSTDVTKVWDEEYDKNVTVKKWTPSVGETRGPGGTILTPENPTTKGKKKKKEQVLALTTQVPDEPVDDDFFDDTDKMVMRALGFTEDDIQMLSSEEYFSPQEIMDFVNAGWCYREILWASEHAEARDLTADEMISRFTPEGRVGAEAIISGAV